MSLCASWRGASLDSSGSEQANVGPGLSPNDSESRRPPQGAEHTPASGRGKLERWMNRSKTPSTTPPAPEQQATPAPANKLDRWLAKSKSPQTQSPAAETPKSKLDRWIAKCKQAEGTDAQGAADKSSQGAAADGFSPEEQDDMMARIREALEVMDRAFAIVERSKPEAPSPDVRKCPVCAKADAADEVAGPRPDGPPRTNEGTQMGLRVEEKGRGLTVTHVVPGGLGDMSGLQVGDIVRAVNSDKVRSLRRFAGAVKEHPGGVVCLELIRGSGAAHQNLTLYARTRPASPSEEGAEEEGAPFAQETLSEQFERERRGGRAEGAKEVSPKGATRLNPARNHKQKFNKYGKDTKLWMPESDESSAQAPGNSASKPAETGGFFMFPPGHPDYVPLPPGEAALIAGRSDVHPNERLAPHWSHIIFTSPSGAEIRAQARHATYGTIDEVSGTMVHAEPLTAQRDLQNAAAVAGNVAYIVRGGAPFTKKARVAVAAGAVACVVANTDKETFGMSFTDDGLPFEALNIPCVMISSDIAEKLQCAEGWSVALVPAKPEQQGTKRPPPACSMRRSEKEAAPKDQDAAAAPAQAATPKGLEGLATLPINPNGASLGRPGKKPTMWKKIKLFLP